MNVRAVLIDDELNNIDNLQSLLHTHCPEVHIAGTATNAEQGRQVILQQQPDIVFLDIQMPGKNGFELLQSLPEYGFEVIFVTAHNQYGIQAVKFAAIDYLLKPIHPKELQLAVNRVLEKLRHKQQNLQLENLIHHLQSQKTEHRIALASQKETRFVPVASIIRCESSNTYTTFYLSNKEKIIASRPMAEYEELLTGYGFVRCHQSHLVNKKFISSWRKEDGGYLLMDNGDQVPVSRAKKKEVEQALNR